jgi:hypothetical protein
LDRAKTKSGILKHSSKIPLSIEQWLSFGRINGL